MISHSAADANEALCFHIPLMECMMEIEVAVIIRDDIALVEYRSVEKVCSNKGVGNESLRAECEVLHQ